VKIFITGSNGKLGKYILSYFLKRKLYCYGNYNKSILRKEIQSKFFIPYKGDIVSNTFSIPTDVNVVCHLASIMPNKSKINVMHNNLKMNKNLTAFISKNKNIKKVIFFSTAAIYGKKNIGKVNENLRYLNTNSYARTKIKSEKIFNKLNGVKVYNIRIPGVLGTDIEENFISNLVKKIKLNYKINLFNPNNLFNNTILVENLCNFLLNLINGKFKSGTILLGSSDPVSLERIVKVTKNILNSKSKVVWNLRNQGFYLDVSKAIKKYNFKPLRTADTIKKYIKAKYML